MNIKRQFRSIVTHNKVTLDKTHKVGNIPKLDDVAPLTAYDDNGQITSALCVDLFCRFVDMQDGKPLTTWQPTDVNF